MTANDSIANLFRLDGRVALVTGAVPATSLRLVRDLIRGLAPRP